MAKVQECLSCGSINFNVIYSGKLRAGSFGKTTNENYNVIQCNDCTLTKLESNPVTNGYYESEEYRNEYNDDVTADCYIEVHDEEQTNRISKIGIEKFRNKTVLDFGCGGGAFLDLIKGVAKKTYGIEPFKGFHKSLMERGHCIYNSSNEALKHIKEDVDIIVSYGVIEHIDNPLNYLKDAHSLLRKEGDFYIETDNIDDILLKLKFPEFEKFYYRTAHYWYFSSKTLNELILKAGFNRDKIDVGFRHNFDISNILIWLRDGKPTGCGFNNFFTEYQNNIWSNMIEENGMADLIFAKIKK